MNAIVYVNTPLEGPEHAALAALARREGRAKGQQLRLLAIQAMRGEGNGSGGGVSSAVIGTAGSDSASRSGSGKKERAPSAVSRRGDRGTAGGILAPAGDALPAAAAARDAKKSMSKSRTAVTGKGGRV
jgi:hypothetical protein